MTPTTRKAVATSSSVALVAAIIGGAWAFTASAATPASVPTPTPTAEVVLDSVPYVSPDTIERKLAAEAEAARLEAERVAAEQAAVAAQAEADRIAAEQAAEAQRQAQQAPAPQAPAGPAAPAPAPVDPNGGNQQVGECREYNDANECTAWYAG